MIKPELLTKENGFEPGDQTKDMPKGWVGKLLGKTICRIFGHARRYNKWKVKDNPRYCYRCGKHRGPW